MNIVLTGMMGTGKSIVGKKLARKLNMSYVDTDEVIEKEAGCSINEIFAGDGEKKFRIIEKKAVKYVSLLNNYVISTGGGVVKYAENMDELEKNAVIICLTADPDTIYKRTKKYINRPLLKVDDPEKEIEKLLKQREKFYSRCDLMIDTSNKKVNEITGDIVKYIGSIKKA